MVRGYTTKEQSKHLLELGLDQSTADMCYIENAELVNILTPFYKDADTKRENFPCWSLTALLELMPVPYQLTSNDEGKYQLMLTNNLRHDWYDTPLDAAFEMVCWLIEQGHIKVNK